MKVKVWKTKSESQNMKVNVWKSESMKLKVKMAKNDNFWLVRPIYMLHSSKMILFFKLGFIRRARNRMLKHGRVGYG